MESPLFVLTRWGWGSPSAPCDVTPIRLAPGYHQVGWGLAVWRS